MKLNYDIRLVEVETGGVELLRRTKLSKWDKYKLKRAMRRHDPLEIICGGELHVVNWPIYSRFLVQILEA